jgi:hypothetical protein
MSWNVAPPDAAPRGADTPGLGGARVRSPYFGALREAWRHAREERDPCTSSLALALCLFTCDARARGIPVDALLLAVDRLIRSAPNTAESAELEPVRAWASAQVIRAYHRAD